MLLAFTVHSIHLWFCFCQLGVAACQPPLSVFGLYLLLRDMFSLFSSSFVCLPLGITQWLNQNIYWKQIIRCVWKWRQWELWTKTVKLCGAYYPNNEPAPERLTCDPALIANCLLRSPIPIFSIKILIRAAFNSLNSLVLWDLASMCQPCDRLASSQRWASASHSVSCDGLRSSHVPKGQ